MHELPINKKKVAELTRKARHYNIAPIFLPRYMPELKRHPISKPLAERVKEAYEYLSILSPMEVEALVDSLPSGIKMLIDSRPEYKDKERLKRVAIYYVVTEVQRIYFSLKGVINEDLNASAVLKIYPELRDKFDEDGLLCVDDDFTLHDGGIEYREHMLHYHQLLRRGYTSNPNFDFTGRFLIYYQQTKSCNRFHIAIDHRRIMPKELYSQIIELDTWFGPSFNREKLDDPNAVGLTVIKRNKDSLFELTNSLDRTEFFWSHRNDIKTFEIEEVSDIGFSFERYYINKYVHSDRNIEHKVTRHIDGAAKVYLKDNYPNRISTHMPTEFKCHKKIKLWRIDGGIDLDSWIQLTSLFYKGNEMIIEYFNPEEFVQVFDLRVRDFKAWERQQANQKQGL